MEEAGVMLGSNRGKREYFIRRAAEILAAHPAVGDFRVSGIYESEPLYLKEQSDFLNAAAVFLTGLDPFSLLSLSQKIEKELGRKRGVRYGPRVIDIDILYYGTRIINKPDLQIPHPRIGERRFVLLPLAELKPEWNHPVDDKSIAVLLNQLGKRQVVTYRGSLKIRYG